METGITSCELPGPDLSHLRERIGSLVLELGCFGVK